MRRINWIFLVTLVIPTALALLYFGLLASDVFVSESHFVVRSPQRTTPTGIGALLQGSGFARSQDDTYSVNDFVRSRDALRELDSALHVRAAFSSDRIDRINRFAGVDPDSSFEAFFRYYQNRVTVDYDSVSSISTLTVRAYTAQDARSINDMLLHMGERLVNNVNDRSRKDLIDVAQQEVQLAQEKALKAGAALAAYRASGSVFDPTAQSALQLEGVAKIQADLLATEALLAQVKQVSPNNPQVASLTRRAEGLRNSIAAESGKVTGASASFNSKVPVYDRLLLDKGFADKQLSSAMASLEEARSQAQRKQLYLERVVEPNLPDMATEPKRLRSIGMVVMLGLICWGVVSLVVASVREHAN